MPIEMVARLARRVAVERLDAVGPIRKRLQLIALAMRLGSAIITLNIRVFVFRSIESEEIVGWAPVIQKRIRAYYVIKASSNAYMTAEEILLLM